LQTRAFGRNSSQIDALRCASPPPLHGLQHAYVGELVSFAALHPTRRRVRWCASMSCIVHRESGPPWASRDASIGTLEFLGSKP